MVGAERGCLNREHVVYVVEVYVQDKLFNQLTYRACPDFGRLGRRGDGGPDGRRQAQSAIKANNCPSCVCVLVNRTSCSVCVWPAYIDIHIYI